MKARDDSYFFLALMLIMAATIVWSLRMEYFLSKLLPIIVAGIVFAVASIGLIRAMSAEHRQASTSGKGATSGEERKSQVWPGYLRSGGWILGFFFTIYLFGFIVSIPLFVLFYMRSHGVRWLTVVVSTVVTPILIYGIFELGLKITLYRGLLFTWMSS